jgi:hypothetical protein
MAFDPVRVCNDGKIENGQSIIGPDTLDSALTITTLESRATDAIAVKSPRDAALIHTPIAEELSIVMAATRGDFGDRGVPETPTISDWRLGP